MEKSSFLPRKNKGYFGQKGPKTLFGNRPRKTNRPLWRRRRRNERRIWGFPRRTTCCALRFLRRSHNLEIAWRRRFCRHDRRIHHEILEDSVRTEVRGQHLNGIPHFVRRLLRLLKSPSRPDDSKRTKSRSSHYLSIVRPVHPEFAPPHIHGHAAAFPVHA